MKPYVIDGQALVKRMLVALLCGAVVGIAVTAAGFKSGEIDYSEQKSAMSVCPMPKTEGEMTIYVVENGAIKCWRWK